MSNRSFYSILTLIAVGMALLVVEFVYGPTHPWQVLAFVGLTVAAGGLSVAQWWTPVSTDLPSYFLRNRTDESQIDPP